jgi:hypothetical protein
VRILYFADIRFPLERANGIQTIETCYALAERGHRVDLVVRPDTHTPPRDPFEYYNLPRQPRLVIELAPMTGGGLPSFARRMGYLSYAAGRAMGSGRADVVMTRDLTVAWLLLHMPGHAAVVFESHGYAPDVAAALPQLVTTASAPSQSKLDRLAQREAYVWAHAEGYVTITAGLADDLRARFGGQSFTTGFVSGQTRVLRRPAIPGPAIDRSLATPAISIRGKASMCCCRRSRRCPT